MNEFQYHKKEESDIYAFYQIPKELFNNNYYAHISTDAKLLYGILRDRNELSKKNNWTDDNGRIYIIFTREEAAELLKFGKDKIVKLFKELNSVNLIKEVRQGLNKPNIIYVGKIILQNIDDSRKSENPTSGNLKNRVQDIGKTDSNNTYINNTYINNKTTTEEENTNIKNEKNVVVNTKPIKPNIKDQYKSVDKNKAQEYKTKIEQIVGDEIPLEAVDKLLKEYGEDKINTYLTNWDKFKSTNKDNPIGFFIGAVKIGYVIPKKQEATYDRSNSGISNMHNFEQREYTSQDFEKYYYKVDDESTL